MGEVGGDVGVVVDEEEVVVCELGFCCVGESMLFSGVCVVLWLGLLSVFSNCFRFFFSCFSIFLFSLCSVCGSMLVNGLGLCLSMVVLVGSRCYWIVCLLFLFFLLVISLCFISVFSRLLVVD